jgi:D-sedoheptulose 7-phosphate isomerase
MAFLLLPSCLPCLIPPHMSFTQSYLEETQRVVAGLNAAEIEKMVDELARVRECGGRLFILGVGGSAANASHAVNDFRKICGFEAYAPTDNVSELTARTNDEGWATVLSEWLKGSRLNAKDGLLIFSVGGGNVEKNVSPNLVSAIQLAKQVGASIVGIVGRDGGYTAKEANACVIVPTVNPEHVTPHSEAFQAVVWHLFVSHPKLKVNKTKWEGTK